LLLGGVFQRFPKLKYCLTELGGAWVVPMLEQLDLLIERVRSGASGEMRYTADDMPLTMTATEMFHQSCHLGASMAGPADVAAREQLGLGAIMWGSDYPHDEGTHPYSLERIRFAFHDIDPRETYAMLTGNAAELYEFDVDRLVPLANEVGPTVAEVQTPLDTDEAAKIPRRV
jgi:predicted TIM-barrel fold metal-dependent hydrolase